MHMLYYMIILGAEDTNFLFEPLMKNIWADHKHACAQSAHLSTDLSTCCEQEYLFAEWIVDIMTVID